jgi:hypothetical protein
MTILKIEKTRQPSIIGQANRAIFPKLYEEEKQASLPGQLCRLNDLL